MVRTSASPLLSCYYLYVMLWSYTGPCLGRVSTLAPEVRDLPFQSCIHLATDTPLDTTSTRYYTPLWVCRVSSLLAEHISHSSSIPVLRSPGYIHAPGHHQYKVLHTALGRSSVFIVARTYISFVFHSSPAFTWLHPRPGTSPVQGTTHRSGWVGCLHCCQNIYLICLPFQSCVHLATSTPQDTTSERYHTPLWVGRVSSLLPEHISHSSSIPVLRSPGYIHAPGHHQYKVLHTALGGSSVFIVGSTYISFVFHSSLVSTWLHPRPWTPPIQGTTHRSRCVECLHCCRNIYLIRIPFQSCVHLATSTSRATTNTRYYTPLWVCRVSSLLPEHISLSPSIPVLCPPSYRHFPGHHCYKILHTSQNWNDSLRLCQNEGGSLVSLETPGEHAAIRPWIVEEGMKYAWNECNTKIQWNINKVQMIEGIILFMTLKLTGDSVTMHHPRPPATNWWTRWSRMRSRYLMSSKFNRHKCIPTHLSDD